MKQLVRIYRWVNLLSLDIALGAVAVVLLFIPIRLEAVDVIQLSLLGLTVWLIYTGDHLLDVYRLQEPAVTKRHAFHQRHFMDLLIAFFFVFFMVGVLLFFVHSDVFRWGILLFNLVVVYMILRNYILYVKELGIAVLFSAGVFLPAIMRESSLLNFLLRPEAGLFFGISMLNLLIFSWYEYDDDRREGNQTFAVGFGRRVTYRVIMIIFAFQFIGLIAAGIYTQRYVIISILFAMSLVLLMLMFFPKYCGQKERYRLIGDGIFLIPLVRLFIVYFI